MSVLDLAKKNTLSGQKTSRFIEDRHTALYNLKRYRRCVNSMAREKRKVSASITVEAALAFPVFFYAIMALCCLFTFMEVRMTIRRAMTEAARAVSPYGELISKADCGASEVIGYISDAIAVRALLEEKLENRDLINSAIEGGTVGIVCAGSELLTGDECIRIKCTYWFKPPVPVLGLGRRQIQQTAEYRYFTGYRVASALEEADDKEPEKTEEKVVYITDQGKVYHMTLSCPALNLHISSIANENVSSARNEGGGRYHPCEKCAKGVKPDTLYITTDGDRYHYKLGCSGLKRMIKEVKASDLKNERLCKRCGKVK